MGNLDQRLNSFPLEVKSWHQRLPEEAKKFAKEKILLLNIRDRLKQSALIKLDEFFANENNLQKQLKIWEENLAKEARKTDAEDPEVVEKKYAEAYANEIIKNFTAN